MIDLLNGGYLELTAHTTTRVLWQGDNIRFISLAVAHGVIDISWFSSVASALVAPNFTSLDHYMENRNEAL